MKERGQGNLSVGVIVGLIVIVLIVIGGIFIFWGGKDRGGGDLEESSSGIVVYRTDAVLLNSTTVRAVAALDLGECSSSGLNRKDELYCKIITNYFVKDESFCGNISQGEGIDLPYYSAKNKIVDRMSASDLCWTMLTRAKGDSFCGNVIDILDKESCDLELSSGGTR